MSSIITNNQEQCNSLTSNNYTSNFNLSQLEEKKIVVSFFNHKYDNLPKEKTLSIFELIQTELSTHEIRPIKDGKSIVLVKFKDSRSNENVVEKHGFALDFDHGAKLDGIIPRLKILGHTCFLYTTYSHQINGEDRFRVVFFFDKPLLKENLKDFKYIFNWFCSKLDGLPDKQPKDISRMHYLPAKASEDAPSYSEFFPGDLVNWQAILDEVKNDPLFKKESEYNSNPTNKNKAKTSSNPKHIKSSPASYLTTTVKNSEIEKVINELSKEPLKHNVPSPNLKQEFIGNEVVKGLLSCFAKEFIDQNSDQPLYNPIIIDNRWHYSDQKQKVGYKVNLKLNENNKFTFRVKIHNFKHGGSYIYLDVKQANNVLQKIYKIFIANDGSIPLPEELKASINNITNLHIEHFKQRNIKQQRDKEILQKKLDNFFNSPPITSNKIHPYLAHKGFNLKSLSLIMNDVGSLRVDEDLLVALVEDIEGNKKGIQTINPLGLKKNLPGSELKSNFVKLGKITKGSRIIICEGIATGLSIKLAQPEATILITLGTNNIEPVVRELRKKFKRKLEILIAADNDQSKDFNAGLAIAHHVALKYFCKLTSPSFDPSQHTSTDFNDSMVLDGLGEVKQQLTENTSLPNPKIALTSSLFSEKLKDEKLFKNFNKIELSSRFLENILRDSTNLIVEIQKHRLVFIKSPIGTGKTELLKNLVETLSNSSTLYVAHLKSLITDVARRLKLADYQDYQLDSGSLKYQANLAICLNSLYKLKNKQALPRFNLLILDEIEQTLSRLTTDIEDKHLIFDALIFLITTADLIVCTDASISEVTINFFKNIFKEHNLDFNPLVIHNQFQVGKDKKVNVAATRHSLLEKIEQAIQENQKIYIATNSIELAKRIHSYLEKHFPNKKGLKVTAENNGDQQVVDVFNNPNKAVVQYDWVVASPAICSGLSIDVEHFDHVFGYFTNLVNTPEDCLQALGRVRKAKEFTIWISNAHSMGLPVTKEDVSAKFLATAKNYELRIKRGILEFWDEEYKKLYLDVKAYRNKAMNNFYISFLTLLTRSGYTVTLLDDVLDNQLKENHKEAKELEQQVYVTNVLKSNLVDNEQAKNIEKKGKRKAEESYSLEKYKILKLNNIFYDEAQYLSDQQLEKLIIKYKKGKQEQEIYNLELIIEPDEKTEQRIEKQDERIKFTADKKPIQAKKEIFRKVLESVGINPDTLLYDGQLFKKDSPKVLDLANWVKDNFSWVNGVFYTNKFEDIEKNLIRFISTILSHLGIKIFRTGKISTGYYSVDAQSIVEIAKILVKRENFEKKLLSDLENIAADLKALGRYTNKNNKNNQAVEKGTLEYIYIINNLFKCSPKSSVPQSSESEPATKPNNVFNGNDEFEEILL